MFSQLGRLLRGPKFGLLAYAGTRNLGDEIQSIAARQFLPRVDHFVDRESMDCFQVPDARQVKIILNGWFCHHPDRWPPARQLSPLLISFHITANPGIGSDRKATEVFAQPRIRDYLRRHAPIGARDLHTLELLRAWHIESYFSGCLSLTLQRPAVAREEDLIIANDLPDDVIAHMRAATSKRIVTNRHDNDEEHELATRLQRAQELLTLYARASCVVTKRLHAALPCLAFGTPVLLLDMAGDQYRFSGLSDLLHHGSVAQFLSGEMAFDIDAPPPNPDRHLALRESLMARAARFTGMRRPPA